MANNISFSGIGSGIDFTAVRDAIINQRSRPIAQMQTKVNVFNNRVEALKQLNGLLAAVTTATQNLTNRDVGTGRAATAADAAIATVNSTSAAALGNIELNVSRIATSFTQASRSYSSISSPVLTNGATFELRKSGAGQGVEITIDSTNNTLAGLRDAINAKGAGVTASIIDLNGDGTQQQLVLNSTETGTSGRVELVETSATGSGADLNFRSVNPPDNDFAKLDAAFSINGLNLTRSSNNVSNAITGLDLTFKKAGSTSIAVAQSNEVEEKLTAFVTAYNAVQDFVAEQYKKDSNNRPTGILAGDSTLRNVQKQLAGITGIESADNGGALNSLTQIGVTTAKNGHLELDKAALGKQLQTNSEDVRALLFGKTAAQNGIFQKAKEISNALSDSVTGSVQTSINGYQSSMKNLNDTIANRMGIINNLRDSLTRRFAAADAAIGQLNGQGTAISNVIKSLQSNNS